MSLIDEPPPRWFTFSTLTLSRLILGVGMASVMALTVAVVALSSSNKALAAQSRSDSQRAALLAATTATHDAICGFYSYQIGPPGSPLPSTPRGVYQVKMARAAYIREHCGDLTATSPRPIPATAAPAPSVRR